MAASGSTAAPFGRLDVPVAEIASIDELPNFTDDWKKRAYCKGAIRIDVAGATILELRLRTTARPIGVLGDGAAGTRVLVAVDEPASFTAAIWRDAEIATAGAHAIR
jgi:hypothetical protein